ncbi:MAG: hypothetical protein MJB14_08150 [Spirochaetes bacterium]|nr:hypothetical protein [Spirochaetota bacterium]
MTIEIRSKNNMEQLYHAFCQGSISSYDICTSLFGETKNENQQYTGPLLNFFKKKISHFYHTCQLSLSDYKYIKNMYYLFLFTTSQNEVQNDKNINFYDFILYNIDHSQSNQQIFYSFSDKEKRHFWLLVESLHKKFDKK